MKQCRCFSSLRFFLLMLCCIVYLPFFVASHISGYSSIYTQCLFQLLGGHHLGNWKLDAEWSLRDLNPQGAPGFYPSLQLQKEALRSMKTSLKYSMSYLVGIHPVGWDSPGWLGFTQFLVGIHPVSGWDSPSFWLGFTRFLVNRLLSK